MLSLINQLYANPEFAASFAGLEYTLDQIEGYKRQRCGRGFSYRDQTGKRLQNPKLKKRIQALVIPPAWQKVWINPNPQGHLLATGFDQAGRKQYLYHPQWLLFRNHVKFYHLLNFASALPGIRRQVFKVIKNEDPFSRAGVLATMLLLLDKGALRVGNEVYYQQRETIGLTTLESSHLQIRGQQIQLDYIGKSGQERHVCLEHACLSQRLSQLQQQASERLFAYQPQESPANEQRSYLQAEDVNQFLQQQSAYVVSAKDFRTWKGTLLAFELMSKAAQNGNFDLPLKAFIVPVAEALGNTPAVAQSSYIHADLLELWQSGQFSQEIKNLKPVTRKTHFSKSEQQLKQLLEKQFEQNFSTRCSPENTPQRLARLIAESEQAA